MEQASNVLPTPDFIGLWSSSVTGKKIAVQMTERGLMGFHFQAGSLFSLNKVDEATIRTGCEWPDGEATFKIVAPDRMICNGSVEWRKIN